MGSPFLCPSFFPGVPSSASQPPSSSILQFCSLTLSLVPGVPPLSLDLSFLLCLSPRFPSCVWFISAAEYPGKKALSIEGLGPANGLNSETSRHPLGFPRASFHPLLLSAPSPPCKGRSGVWVRTKHFGNGFPAHPPALLGAGYILEWNAKVLWAGCAQSPAQCPAPAGAP